MSQISTFDPRRRAREMLQGLKVLDASSDIADRLCVRLMADSFASVALATDADASCTGAPSWGHLDAGKRLETSDVTNWQIFAQPVRGLGIAICNSRRLHAYRSADERIIAVLIAPSGQHGPYAAWPEPEMTCQALSGGVQNDGNAGVPPLYDAPRTRERPEHLTSRATDA